MTHDFTVNGKFADQTDPDIAELDESATSVPEQSNPRKVTFDLPGSTSGTVLSRIFSTDYIYYFGGSTPFG